MQVRHANLDPEPLPPDDRAATSYPETILLVEDDDMVRTEFRRILQTCGYFVMEASDGQEALKLAEEFSQPIHLIVADVNVPQISGPQLAKRVCQCTHPESKVLIVSGSSEQLTEEEDVYPLLLKPFTADVFLDQVRSILGRG
jgi:DNA-binding response OmpR family regulator